MRYLATRLVIAAVATCLMGMATAQTPPIAASYKVVHGWPNMPKGYAFGPVSGVDVDSHNHVFVVHRSKTRPIMMFDGKTGDLLGSWADGLFAENGQHGLEVDDQDNVWVTDIKNHQVMKFSHDGALLMTLGQKGVPGWDSKHFNQPTDIVVAPNGDFYVSDGYGNQRVAKFDKNGTFLLDWGSKGEAPGQFMLPHSVERDKDGRIYVSDRIVSKIYVFDGDGKFLAEWKLPDRGRPWSLEYSPDGYLWVADGGDMLPESPDRGEILKLDMKGNVVAKFGSFGSYDGQFYWAHDVSVGRDGAVYVVDVMNGMRVQKFVPAGK